MRRAVTLVELLITMTIIAILGTAIIGVASVATNTANRARTKVVIGAIHSLLAEQYESYKVRRVRLHPLVEQKISQVASNPTERRRLLSEARLYALREFMLLEMPDRWSDVTLAPNGSGVYYPVYLYSRPGLAALYLREFERKQPTPENQSAECLYMVVMYACGDGESRSLFSEKQIGDTDGDGANEFIDGWGNPISWLRWAPGFDSDQQLSLAGLERIRERAIAAGENGDAAIEAAIAADHDPFDMFRAQPVAFRLLPLVFSAGSDEAPGLWAAENEAQWIGIQQPYQSVNDVQVPLRPLYVYGNIGTSPSYFLGTIAEPSEATDNIHSHLLGTR